jgi:hypothetical protein
MKVQKMVSLDVNTAKIACDMKNFSRFVRIALLAYSVGDDIERERELRRTWKRCSDYLMDHIRNSTDMDQTQLEDLFIAAMKYGKSQTELDFE